MHLILGTLILLLVGGSYMSVHAKREGAKGVPKLASPVAKRSTSALRVSISDDVFMRREPSSPSQEGLTTPQLLRYRGGASSMVSSLPLHVVKGLLQLLLTSLNILCFALPLMNESISGNKWLMGLANSFASGIFLMLAFGHMIPHSIHTLQSIQRDTNITFYAVLAGYLLVFFIEKVAFANQHMDTLPTEGHSSSHDSSKSAIVLLLAMSIHSLMETAALGLAPDAKSAALMAMSIGLHQPAESLALLVAFLKTGMPKTAIIRWLGLFSLVGPLGVSLGIMISKIATPFAEAVIVALTAGTFIFVGATEVLIE